MVLIFFRKKPWDISGVSPPWGDRPSIHSYLIGQLEIARPNLSRANVSLPDEDRTAELRFVAGARDGVFGGMRSDGQEPDVRANSVMSALIALAQSSSDDRAATLYSHLLADPALSYIDELLPRLMQAKPADVERIKDIARWVATGAHHREAVKTAIGILGVLSVGGVDRELFMTLGKHEEFALFSAVAIHHSEQHPEPLLFELAQYVTGWGRVHLVERLANTQDRQIKAWLVREGCRNDIMDEYSALICAKSGDLLTELRRSDPDRAMLKGAGVILSALVRGGPAEDITAYTHGPEAVERYLSHLGDRDADIEDLLAVADIARFLDTQPAEGAGDWRDRSATIQRLVAHIKERPDWPSKIQAGMVSEDDVEVFRAAEAAKIFGIDTWEIHFERLVRGKQEWYAVMQSEDPARIDQVLTLAQERLPLDQIASGPAQEFGLGLEFQSHSALNFIVQELGRFPDKGWTLIRTSLQSPVVRDRNTALRALSSWKRVHWPADAENVIRHAMTIEPDDAVRESMRKTLAGEPLRLE